MNQKKIIYDIGFKVDESGVEKATGSLAKITHTLKQIQGMDLGSFMKATGITDMKKAEQQLKLIQSSAVAVGNALQSSFNAKLNTYNIVNFNKELKNAGYTVKDLGALWTQIGQQGNAAFMQVANAITQTQSIARKTTGVFDKLGETLANTIRWKLTSGLLDTITGSIREAWGYTKALDTSLNNIRIVTGKSAVDMEKFAKSANNAAQKLAASTTAYTNASLIYYQQGLSDEEVEARTKVTIKAANVTGQSAQEVSEQLTAVWNGYKVVAEEAELYVDKLAAVAATTAADLEELSTGMSKVASAANAMGVDIDQLSAQMATIVSVTRQDASLVGTALKTIYARMGDLQVDGVDEFGTSLGDVSGKMKQMGIDVLDQEGNLREMGGVIEEVAKKWGTWTDAQQQAAAVAIAGKRQYNNLIALFENWDMYENTLETSKNAEGTLEEQQKTYKESITAMMQEVNTAKEGFKGELFDSKSIEAAAKAMTGFYKGLEKITSILGGIKTILPLTLGLLIKMSPKFSGVVAKGLHDIAIGTKNLFTGFKSSNAIKKNAQQISESMQSVNKEYNDMINARIRLEAMHKSGLIDDDAYDKAKEKTEAAVRNLEKEAQLLQERENINKQHENAVGEEAVSLDDIAKEREEIAAHNEQASVNPEIVSKSFTKDSKTLQKFLGQIDAKTKAVNTQFNKANRTIKKFGKSGVKDLTKVTKTIDDLSKADYITPEQKKALQGLSDDLANVMKLPADEQEAAVNKISASLGKIKKDYKQNAENIKNEAVLVAQGQDEYTASVERSQQAVQEANEENDKFKGKGVAEGFSQMAGAALSTMAAFSTLEQAMSGARDGTSKWYDVLSGVITSVLTMVPGILTALKLVKGGVEGVGKSAQMAFGVISFVIIGIMAIISVSKIIYGFYKKNKGKSDAKIAAEELAEMKGALTDLQESYKKTRESLAELKDEMADYRNAKKSLEEMRAGTEEWKNAVEDLNTQVLEMLDKYPELEVMKKELHGQVLYEIDPHSFDKAIESREKMASQQQLELALLNNRITQRDASKENETIIDKAKDDYKKGFNEIFGDESIVEDIFLNKEELANRYTKNDFGGMNVTADDLLNFDLYDDADLEILKDSINELTDVEQGKKAEALKMINAIQDHRGTLDTNNKLLEKREKAALAAIAEINDIDETVFTDLGSTQSAKIKVGVADKIKGAKANDGKYGNEVKSDFIRNEGDNRFTLVEMDAQGNILLDKDNNIKTELGGNVGKTIDAHNDDAEQVYEWLLNLAQAAYGLDATVTNYDDVYGKSTSNDELASAKVTVNGTEMTVAQLRQAVFSRAQRQLMEKENEKLIKFQKRMQSEGKLEEAAYFSQDVRGASFDATNVGWDDATLAKYDTIISYNDEDTKANAEAGQTQFKTDLTKILKNSIFLGSKEDPMLSAFEQLTLSDATSLAASVTNAGIFEGGDTALRALIASIQDPTKMKKVQEMLANADWTSSEWITNFQVGLHELDIPIGDETVWGAVFNKINSGMKQWADNSERVRENLAFVKDTIEDLEVGESISDEDYTKLLSIDPTAAKNFIRGADGWVALASGSEIATSARSKYSALGDMQKEYGKIRTNANSAISAGVRTGQGSDLTTLASLASYFGYTLTFDNAGKITGIENTDTERTTALASLLGIGKSSIEDLLTAIQTDPSQRDGITQNLQSLAKKADQMLIDYSTGYYDDQSAVDIYATSGISYDEAEAAGAFNYVDEDGNVLKDETAIINNAVNKDDVANRKKYFTNQLKTELGFSSGWGADFSYEKVSEMAENVRKSELDYLIDIENELDECNRLANKLVGTQKQAQLDQIIELSKDKATVAANNETIARSIFNTAAEGIIGSITGLTDSEIVSKLREQALSQDEKIAENANKALEYYEGLVDASEAAAEAQYEVIDAQIEAYKYQKESVKEFLEWEKKLVEFNQEFKKLNGSSLNFFGPESAAAMIINARELFEEEAKNYALNYAFANGTQNNSIFSYQNEAGETIATDAKQYGEVWAENIEDVMSSLTEMKSQLQAMYSGYIEAQTELMEMFDKEIEKLTTINNILTGAADLWRIVGKSSETYLSNLGGYYDTMSNNARQAYELALAKAKEAKQQALSITTDASQEMVDTVMNNLSAATEATVESAKVWMETIANEFQAKMSAIIDSTVGEFGLEGMTEQWELYQASNDGYLDQVNSQYGIDSLSRKIQKSIDETDNYAAQKKLMDLRMTQEEKLNIILEQRGKLSQYELDRANAEYELTLKQIALEEAQQTANKMKLTRDAFGNYSYQYVQDQDAIAQATEEFEAAKNELYNLDKSRNEELVSNYYSSLTEANEKIAEAVAAGDLERAERLKNYYFGERGVLSTMREELSAMSTIFNGADWQGNKLVSFVNEITNSNFGSLVSSIDELLGDDGVGGKFSLITSAMELLGSSTIPDAVALLNASVQSADNITSSQAYADLKNAIKDVNLNLGPLVNHLSTLVTDTSNIASAYKTWLDNNTSDNQAVTSIKTTLETLEGQFTSYWNNIANSGFKVETKDDGTFGVVFNTEVQE